MGADIHLLRPYWLLAAVPALVLLVWLWRRPRALTLWERVVDAHLLPYLLVGTDQRPVRWPLTLLGFGWLLAVLALAGPAWERLPQPLYTTSAAQVVVLDLSPSMNAADLRPSRLARARFEILDLLNAQGGGQTGLLAFGPEPFVVSPLTWDAQTIAAQVPNLTTDLLPVQGARNTARALAAAGELLARAGPHRGDIILVTDGLSAVSEVRVAVRALVEAGHRVSVLAVGTVAGAPAFVPGAALGDGGFAREAGGAVSVERLPEQDLREIADLGRGRYVQAQPGDADTRALADLGAMQAEAFEDPALKSDQWREEGPWLLLVLLPLAALAFRRGWLLPVLACVLILPAPRSAALGWSDLWWRADQQALRMLEAGADRAAAESFDDPAWRAAARYRAGEFERALDDLSSLGDDPRADYNRGNALARLGRLDEAIAAYDRVLARDPDHADARHNRAVVEALRDRPPESPRQPQDPGDEGGEGEGEAGADASPGGPEGPSDEPRQTPDADGSTESGAADQETSAGAEGASGTESERSAGGAGEDPTAGDPGDRAGPLEEGPDPGASRSAPPQGPASSPQPSASAPSSASEGTPGDLAEVEDVRLPEQADPGEGPAPAGAGSASDDSGAAPGDRAAQASSPLERERQQSLEAQLRRVPDDPGGLLRQRFLLQHLRRQGRLP
jgi:Ca-activated chloride channel family protein